MNIKKCEFKIIRIFPLFIFSLVSFYFDNGLIIFVPSYPSFACSIGYYKAPEVPLGAQQGSYVAIV